MKIHLDNVNLNSKSGPNSFAMRLFVELNNQGYDVVENGHDADVSLVFIEPSGNSLAKKVVQRLDGIWFKPNEFETKNVRIKKLYNSANAVVWQSTFDRGMTTKWWGVPTKGYVIRNGIQTVQSVNVSDRLLDLRSRFETIFVAAANWHPQKRLRSNIQLFDDLRKKFYHNSCLIVLGNNPDCWVGPPVMYAGSLSHDECQQIYSISDWMIHLAWLDHCPNVVVEALNQRLPVICSESGGTNELVGDFGVVLKEGVPYNFELSDYDNPPDFDFTQITEPLPVRASLGSPADVSIVETTKRYIQLFENI